MLEIQNFKKIIIANWKLNGSIQFAKNYIKNIDFVSSNDEKNLIVCPPVPLIPYLKSDKFYIGAQDTSIYNLGAFTGEISADSLADINVDFCIVGHSERRQFFFEKNEEINYKSENLIKNNIIPIICIGETLEDKEKGITNDILEEQLKKSIPISSNFENTIIAYEPVWAIGTGLTPTNEEINDTHKFIREHDAKFNKFKIIYGGSVKSNNAKEITSLLNVDGTLIGGASLKSDEFTKIIQD